MKNRVIRMVAAALALMLMLGMALAEVRTTGKVWLRTGPGLDYDPVKILSEGKTFDYLGESSVDGRGVTWYKVTDGDKEGWVSSRYAELTGESVEAGAEDAEASEPAEAPESQSAPEDAPEAPEEEAAEEATEEADGEAPAEAPSNGPVRAVELSGYYLNNLVEAANDIGLISYRQVESEAPFQYYDESVIIAGNQLVENIVVYGEGYEVYGVSVGMSVNAARACLNAAGLDYVESVNGVTYGHRAGERSRFTDPNGHDSCINVWVDENDTVTEIDWSSYTG